MATDDTISMKSNIDSSVTLCRVGVDVPISKIAPCRVVIDMGI
jgi:hypothetical protein